jgi:arabinofuranan 3-O-arabinosyltransferase
LAVGVHPIDDRSPLMRIFARGDDGGLALALRSSTRALPVAMLGIALAIGMAVEASSELSLPRLRIPTEWLAGGFAVALAIVNLPALWTGGFVDEALERDQSPPTAWLDAAAVLGASGDASRVLQLPGEEFGAYRWGYTVDQPLPGLTDKPVVTRDLLPLGSAGAMDLLYALDDRIQEGVLESNAIAPVARLLGVDAIWLTNDIAFDRFRTARPEVVRDAVIGADGVDAPERFGELMLNRPDVPMTDERAVGDDRVGAPIVPVELVPITEPGTVVRSAADTLVVSGSGDGLVDAAAAGLLDGRSTTVRYSADLDDRATVIDDAVGLLVTDSNRDQARHWRSSQDTRGYTEPGGSAQDVLRPVASDARLDVFASTDASTQTVAEQRGPATATATAYGEPFAYLPEHRPYMSIDGDPATAWLVGEHGDPIGESIHLDFDDPVDRLLLRQPTNPGDRHITTVLIRGEDGSPIATADLGESSWVGQGQEVVFGAPVMQLEIEIEAVAGGTPFTGSAVAGVGFAEIDHGLGPTTEVVRPPIDALSVVGDKTPVALEFTRLRTDPMDRWRDDPEPRLIREFELPMAREFVPTLTVRIDARASDDELAGLFGWPAAASTRLPGSPRHAGVSALDGDPATTWITAFGEAQGASLRTSSTREISMISVSQPVAGFSRVTELTVGSGDESRTVSLTPDAAGGATGVVAPPLPAGEVEFVLSGIDPVTTVDRRFGDPVTLPAAISELTYEGRPTAERVGPEPLRLTCVPVAAIDGKTVTATIHVDGWLDGAALAAEPCDGSVSLGSGAHLLTDALDDVPVTLDRVVLDDGLRAGLAAASRHEQPRATVLRSGRFERSIEISNCSKGCWLVVGEGYSEAWSADQETAGSLGKPELVDGGFNGWWIEPTTAPVVVRVRWTAQRPLTIAIILSCLAVVVAAGLLILDRRRREGTDDVAICRPRLFSGRSLDPTRRHSIVLIVVWAGLSGLMIAPEWALWGAVGGLGAMLLRRCRVPELTALASLLAVAVVVVGRERRSAPAPNGGWPSTFESVHALGMFAVVSLLVGILITREHTGEHTGDHGEESDA